MLKWIRPSGALFYSALILLIALFWWLTADWLLKASIETAGTKLVGARVELRDADVSFNPLGFQLKGLQVTNPKQPMQNLMQLEQAKGSLDLIPLLMGQVIIDELSATGIKMNTERKVSGEVKKSVSESESQKKSDLNENEPVEENKKGALKSAAEKLPSVDDILAKEPLATIDQIKSFNEKIKSERSAVNDGISALPDEAKLKKSEEQIKQLTEGNINSPEELKERKQNLDKIKESLQKDRDAIISMRERVKSAKSNLGDLYKNLKNAPSEDWNRIKSKYSLNAAGAGNVAGMLFGERAQIWLQRILVWAEQARKFMPSDTEKKPEPPKRNEGRLIHFPTSNPLPDFLIRKAILNIEIPAGEFDLQVNDVTHQPNIIGRPMRLMANGQNLKNAKQIKIDGVIDHVKPGEAKDTIKWSLTGVNISNLTISKNANLPIEIASTKADFSGDFLQIPDSFTANARSDFKATNWKTSEGTHSDTKLVKFLTSIQEFNINAQISGKLSAPDFKLDSDIDDQLKKVLNKEIESAKNNLETKFKDRLNKEVASAGGQYTDQLAFMTDKEKTLDQRIEQLNQMLSAKIKSAAETKKQESKDKVKDKLKGLKF